MNRWAELSKRVGWQREAPPAPPSPEEVQRALDSDNRFAILNWWRHCKVGTINGEVGKALSAAMAEVRRRCNAEDEKWRTDEREGQVQGLAG